MTQLGEGIAITTIAVDANKCPFCDRDEHDFPEKKKVDVSQIKSKPASLGCGDLSPKQEKGKYGRARHHMIPAHQCYTKVLRIARRGEAVGYDINNKKNGIPLPTVWNEYEVNGENVNFGDLPETEKDKIRNSVMRETGAQWHVGNHHYETPEMEDATDGMSDEGELDHQPYDIVVLKKLRKIADKARSKKLCDTDEQDKVTLDLDKLCKEIETKLNKFKSNPSSSKQYFVSKWAMAFKG